MSEENKVKAPEQSSFDQFYKVVKGYVEYCIQNPKKKLTDKEKECLSEGGIVKKEEELKALAKSHEEQRMSFQKAYDAMCDTISKDGVSSLSLYVDALKKLYETKSDWKRDIKSVLIGAKSLKLFREAQSNIVELYPILLTLNKTFPVDEYAELSLAPKAAMYGSEVNKTAKGSTKKAPLKNEEIQAMLELFIQVKDFKRFGEWLMSILVFAPDQITEGFENEYVPMREQLKEWAYKQINSNDSYKRAVIDTLLKNKMLNVFVDAFVEQPVLKAKQAGLEEKIKKLEEDNEKEKADHEDRRRKQHEIILEKEASLAELRERVKDFERCKQQLTVYMEKYQAQVDMNERITSDNARRIQTMETDYDRMQDELSAATMQLENLQTAHSALQSDFSLKNNELQRMRDMASQKEETARTDLMRELVSGINEQFFYLTMFYLELKDTGKLEPESIELYADTINKIDDVLADMGIKKIGVIDQKVSYDASIHISTDARISNGEQVVVSGYGWKIGDEVYIKAPVEKGE